MRKIIFGSFLVLMQFSAIAQFAPPAGQPGTTAMYKDSSVFVEWANGCSVVRGYQDINNTTLGYASSGDSSLALGVAGANGVVSLGDGGSAIVRFAIPISNGPSWDFAVFENGFSDTYLELAYVEVSSDGINYFRFPCTSNTQDTAQVGGFGSVDATKIDNLAGKYRALYGTPFDLQELALEAGLDINAVTYVKIMDVVGCIQPAYARFDQFNQKINDPWNTPFASGGFDLDAVGVIHTAATGVNEPSFDTEFNIYPNPAKKNVSIRWNDLSVEKLIITDLTGRAVKVVGSLQHNGVGAIEININDLQSAVYFISAVSPKGTATKKLIVNNE